MCPTIEARVQTCRRADGVPEPMSFMFRGGSVMCHVPTPESRTCMCSETCGGTASWMWTVSTDSVVVRWVWHTVPVNLSSLPRDVTSGRNGIRRSVVVGSISDGVIGFLSWRNPFSITTALGLTQPLTEVSTRNILGYKWRPAGAKTDNLTASCEPIA
jgi:hypothetical protein